MMDTKPCSDSFMRNVDISKTISMIGCNRA